jgi:roadblock/LC7 domain-containing protein
MQIFAQQNIISGDLKGFVNEDKVDFNEIVEGYKLWLDKQ